MDTRRWFDGTSYKEANVDRARKLRDKWNDALADVAFHLTVQPKSAWSFEVEARPFKESW